MSAVASRPWLVSAPRPVPAAPSPVPAAELARWRRVADALMVVLADDLDAIELAHEDDRLALVHARGQCLQRFQTTVGQRLAGLVPSGPARVRPEEIQQADDHWGIRAELALAAMDRDPAAVERFVRLWLGVVQDAAAQGRAALFVR